MTFTPSLLDRLRDTAPGVATDPLANLAVTLRVLKEQVMKDLQDLLNTRVALRPAELQSVSQLEELRESILLFGIPDFTQLGLSRPDSQRLVKSAIEQAILRFEQRLTHVVVTVVDADRFERHLRFRIDASLRVKPSPEAVSYRTDLELANRRFTLELD